MRACAVLFLPSCRLLALPVRTHSPRLHRLARKITQKRVREGDRTDEMSRTYPSTPVSEVADMSVLVPIFFVFSALMWIAGVTAVMKEKGLHDSVGWNVLAAFLGPFAMLVVLMLPRRLHDLSRYD